MTISRRVACFIYGALGVIALLGTWSTVIADLPNYGLWEGFIKFWQDALINGSSRFLSIDVLFLSLAAFFWMLMEARRLAIRFAWLYVVLSIAVASSFAIPMFLLHRELKLSSREPGASASLGYLDMLVLAGVTAATLVFTAVASGKGPG